MGQPNQFEAGWEVPNNGVYIEIGEHPDSQNHIRNPKRVKLKKGDHFPGVTNANRKWTRVRGHHYS